MNLQVLPQNVALIANTFTGTNQEIASVLPSVPDGVMIWKPAPGGASWELNWFAHGSRLGHPTMRLPSGEGFWIYNPALTRSSSPSRAKCRSGDGDANTHGVFRSVAL